MENLFDAVWKDVHDKSEISTVLKIFKPLTIKEKREGRELLKKARPFVVDNTALEFMLDITNVSANRTLERVKMARLPFPVMWIELNLRHKIEYAHELGFSSELTDEAPERIGWLLEEIPNCPEVWKVSTFLSHNKAGMPSGEEGGRVGETSSAAITWYVDTEGLGRFPKKTRIASLLREKFKINGVETSGGYREQIEQAVIDSAFSVLNENGDGAFFRNFADFNVEGMSEAFFEYDYEIKKKNHDEEYANLAVEQTLLDEIAEARGDLRLLVTALATITKLPVKFSQKKKKGSFRGAGEIKQYLDYSEVTIQIPRKRAKFIRDMERELRKEFAKKKRHEVMGHWRTSDRQIEDWVPYYDEQFKCTRFKRWIKSHMRGDASLGFIQHTNYKVTR